MKLIPIIEYDELCRWPDGYRHDNPPYLEFGDNGWAINPFKGDGWGWEQISDEFALDVAENELKKELKPEWKKYYETLRNFAAGETRLSGCLPKKIPDKCIKWERFSEILLLNIRSIGEQQRKLSVKHRGYYNGSEAEMATSEIIRLEIKSDMIFRRMKTIRKIIEKTVGLDPNEKRFCDGWIGPEDDPYYGLSDIERWKKRRAWKKQIGAAYYLKRQGKYEEFDKALDAASSHSTF
jgi:hypothetical protein